MHYNVVEVEIMCLALSRLCSDLRTNAGIIRVDCRFLFM